jgi:hypothetical protein
MKSVFCFLFFCFTSLNALEPLNNLDYTLSSEEWSFFNRDSVIHISQENRLIGTVEGRWSLTKYADQPAYILLDDRQKIVAQANVYRKANQPFALFFEINDSMGSHLGTLAVEYPIIPISGGIRIATQGILYSNEGVPLLEDLIPILSSTHLSGYIPGTKQQVVDLVADSYFMPTYKMHAKIVDLPYIALMNISPELYLMYMVIRKEVNNYTFAHSSDVYPIYYN